MTSRERASGNKTFAGGDNEERPKPGEGSAGCRGKVPGSGREDGHCSQAGDPGAGMSLCNEFEHMKWEVSEAHLVAQLEALTEVGQAEPREKPTSTSASGVGLAHQHLN